MNVQGWDARVVVVALSCATWSAGCGESGTTDDEVGASSAELTDASTAEAAVVATMNPASMEDGPAAAQSVADEVVARLGSCAVAATEGRTTTMTLDACTGPWGRAELSGTVVGTYQLTREGTLQGTLDVDLSSSEGATLTFDAEADFRADGTIAVTSSASGLGRRGRAVGRTGDYVLTPTDTCVTVDGTWSGREDAWTLAVSEYTMCDGACPVGTVVRTGPLAGTLVFDGTATATFTSGEDVRDIPLACGP